MTISYRWLSEYLPKILQPEALSSILTSIGLEVESMEQVENYKGGLAGLVVGEVMEVLPHPNADKLKLTQVNIGGDALLRIVCGASNVAQGQKVVVAVIGTTLYPKGKDPITMKLAKIRGEQSEGMICAEDEIGLSDDHEGILVLDAAMKIGTPLSDLFEYEVDWIYEIGLTPNRMDAMSHYGVAKDVCAYLSYHELPVSAISPYSNHVTKDPSVIPLKVIIEDEKACARYSGMVIDGVEVKDSPTWLKNRLKAIGVRTINNIVDITNFILHETGQPIHAFDAHAIKDNTVVIKKYPQGTKFTTLDGVERVLTASDLMISDVDKPICLAGVFGGIQSGVKESTTKLFLESAWFENVPIRKTSLHHGLRTDAATRFEKGVDIDGTVNVLERAAKMIQDVAGGKCSEVIDQYPSPFNKKKVHLKYAYLKKLSGKLYSPDKVKIILKSLGFEIIDDTLDGIELLVPFHKPDISIPADIVEEVLRIDGLDNIEIPSTITMSPSIDPLEKKEKLKEKLAQFLVGRGYTEILTNSITNSAYFSEEVLARSVKMLNNLSAELDVMRPSMLETGLETIAYNLNRQMSSIALFEMGTIYGKTAQGSYYETEQLSIYISGKQLQDGWRTKGVMSDFFVAKGIAAAIFNLLGMQEGQWKQKTQGQIDFIVNKKTVGVVQVIGSKKLHDFGIKQPVLYIQFDIANMLSIHQNKQVVYQEISKYPSIERDLSLVIPQATTYEAIESCFQEARLDALKDTQIFDIFESDKLGFQKKSVAIHFVFNDSAKTLTDGEIDGMMKKLVLLFEKNIQAEVRK